MDQTEAEGVLDDLLEADSGLTEWEMDFLESLDGQRGRPWSEKQMDVLGRIAERLGI